MSRSVPNTIPIPEEARADALVEPDPSAGVGMIELVRLGVAPVPLSLFLWLRSSPTSGCNNEWRAQRPAVGLVQRGSSNLLRPFGAGRQAVVDAAALCGSSSDTDTVKARRELLNRLTDAVGYAV